MAVDAPTAAQQSTIDELVTSRRLEAVPVDLARAAAFLSAADERLEQSALLTSTRVRYDLAYDAAHDVGEALLAAYGYRTRSGPGQHDTVGRFLRAIIDGPPGDRAAAAFDRLRRTRNQSHYRAHPIGVAEATLAEQAARDLRAAADARGLDR